MCSAASRRIKGVFFLPPFASVLGVGGYKYNGILPSGTDLNNLTDEHLSYYISNADNISHIPSAISGGVLQCLIQVDRFYGSQYNVVQKLIVIPDIVTFTRCYSNDNWTDWRRVYDETILSNSTVLSQLAAALGVAMLDNNPRFKKSTLNNFLSLGSGIYLAGGCASDYSDGSIYFVMKKEGVDFIKRRIDNGTKFVASHNEGGTWIVDTSTTDNKDSYAWSLQLA